MLLSAHVTVGAAVGSTIGNPFLASITSFISYYLINCIPHWEPKNNEESAKYAKIIKWADGILSIVISVLFSTLLPSYINNTQSTLPNAYTMNFGTIALPFGNISFSPIILLYCLFSILPYLLKILDKKLKGKISILNYNNLLLKKFNNQDNRFLGKVIHIATIVVFGLYTFRLIPNSDSPIFLQIILFIIIIVSFLAILETFSAEDKPEEKV